MVSIFFSPGSLQSLSVLKLARNKLREFPLAILRLEQLRHLDLSSNEIARIPERISACQMLKYLILNHNRLRRLPRGMTRLRALEKLEVSDNQLVCLPVSPFVSRSRIICHCNGGLRYLPCHLADGYEYDNDDDDDGGGSKKMVDIQLECDSCFSRHNNLGDLSGEGFSRVAAALRKKRRRHHFWLDEEWIESWSLLDAKDLQSPQASTTPPTLVELCLREAKRGRHCLPRRLSDLLADGPAAVCAHCRRGLFTSCLLTFKGRWVDPSPFLSGDEVEERRRRVPVLFPFCSRTCMSRHS